MELFGRALDGQAVAGLVGLVGMLAYLLLVLRERMRDDAWLKRRRDAWKARRDKGAQGPGHGGPWG